MKERSETADRVMRIMTSYNLIPGVEVADYLSYTVELGRRCGVKIGKKDKLKKRRKIKTDEERAKRREEKRERRMKKNAKLLEEKRKAGRKASIDGAPKKTGKRRRKKRAMTKEGVEVELSESESCSSTDSSSSESSSSSSDSSGDESSEESESEEDEKNKAKKVSKNTNDGNAEYGGSMKLAKKKTKKLKQLEVRKKTMSKGAAERHKLARHLSLHPKDPFVDTYKPHILSEVKTQAGIKKSNAKRVINHFKNAGWGSNIRTGNSETDLGHIPALLTIPDCYETGKKEGRNSNNKSGDRGGGEMEKSYLAAKIMQDLRNKQVDKNTGALKRDAMPLYHRVSMDEGETYSDLVGRPFYYFSK